MIDGEDREGLEELLEFLRTERGFDFMGYKRSSLARRTTKRMHEVGIPSYRAYIEYLTATADEFEALLNTILINVTSFFRDPETWEHLRDEILPAVVERRDSEEMRIWSAGCASGQEPLSVGMLLADLLGMRRYQAAVKIYATDVDEEALAEARRSEYPLTAMKTVPEELQERYFDREGQRARVAAEIRRSVIFGRHNLVTDPPISHIDLLLCRNTLMYLSAPVQTGILKSFHFALRPGGYLCLGESEVMLTRTDLFEPVDLKRRVFRANEGAGRYHGVGLMPADEGTNPVSSSGPTLHAQVFHQGRHAQIILRPDRVVDVINQRARELFGLTDADLGRPLQDLEVSYRPAELRAPIEQAERDRAPVVLRLVEWARPDADTIYLDIQVAPIFMTSGDVAGLMLTFDDATDERQVAAQVTQSQREVETTNEELQSTVEELETTNEELQSTVEELETTNEELQSTNEELETMNDELRQRSTELNDVNFYFESVLLSLRVGVVVTDPGLHVTIWNRESENLWGLRSEEVQGQHLLNLDIGLPVHELREPARRCLSGESPTETLVLPAVNRRGRAIRCHVSCFPLARGKEIHGVVMLMEDVSEEPSAVA